MKVKKTAAKYSAIVSISEELKRRSQETQQEYLYLNRGVNSVVNIDLTQVIPLIDFNSNAIQVYPANNGRMSLKQAINDEFFQGKAKLEDLFITAGGMNGLRLTTEILDVKKIYISKLYWGAYTNIMKMNDVAFSHYDSFEYLLDNLELLKGSAVIICDPNNPVGNKYDDAMLLELAKTLNDHGVVVLWDSPYRRLFLDKEDSFYAKLSQLEHVIILESFSKSIGLSGQRLGFVYCSNAEFAEELKIRLLYTANGVNAFAQVLVEKILTTKEGRLAMANFKKATVHDIKKNIQFLMEHGLLAERFYEDSQPIGIFVIVNRTSSELMEHRIGSVALPYFTSMPEEEVKQYARICVSTSHDKFKSFFSHLLS